MIKSTEFISTKLFYKKAVLWEKNPQITFQCFGIFGEWPNTSTSLILRYTEYK